MPSPARSVWRISRAGRCLTVARIAWGFSRWRTTDSTRGDPEVRADEQWEPILAPLVTLDGSRQIDVAGPSCGYHCCMYLDSLEFLEEEREAWASFEALAGLTDEQLSTPVAAAHGWSGRQLMAHLVAWQEVAL